MAPVVHRLEQRYAGKIAFVYLDTDDPAAARLAREMKTLGHPHYFLLDAEGNVYDQWYGLLQEEQLTRVFDAMLAGEPAP